ncbi:MAG: DinB family protein [Candidatus Sulfotelmatobacter sp.]
MPKASDPPALAYARKRFANRLPVALLNAFNTNNRINQYLIDSIPPAAWRAKPPDGKGRTIAAIVAHMHNVRVMWLKVAAKGSQIPRQLDRTKVTPIQALRAAEHSRLALCVVISGALESDGRVKGFRPDVAGFVVYLVAHDAHHRGQIAMLARQVGYPLPQKAMFGLWEWGSR